MYLVSQLSIVVIISSVTSTLLLFVWRLFRRWFMRVNPKLINVTLKMVCVTYLLPIGYLAILLSKHRWLKGIGSAWKLYFARTRHITCAIYIIEILWIVIASIRLLICFGQNKRWCRRLKDNIPIVDDLSVSVFNKVCKDLNIPKGKVMLQCNPLITTPMIVKVFRPQVLLPERDFTEKELELIFYHELSHYKHHDLKWGLLVAIITVFQSFNPLVCPLDSIVSFWEECMADISALEISGNMYNVKQYYEKIEKIMPELKERKRRKKYFFADLYRSDKTMIRRVEFVQSYRNARKCSKQVSICLLTAFLVILFTLDVGAGICMADLHKFIYRATENDSEIRIVEDVVIEHYTNGSNWSLVQKPSSKLLETGQRVNGGNYYRVDLEVEEDQCWTTDEMKLEVGQSIDLSAGVPLIGVDYWIGLLNENQCACYIQVNGSVSHNFEIEEAGKYRIFVKNNKMEESDPYILVNYKVNGCE